MSLSILPTSRWLPKRRRPPMVVKRQSRHSWPRLRWETRVRLITSAEYKQRLVRTLSRLPLGSAHRRCAGTWFIPSNGGRNGAGIRLWFGSTRLLLSVDRPRPENPADQRRARIYCRYRSFQRGIFTPYSDSSFDVVVSCESIEHLLRDPPHMLLESWRVLEPWRVLKDGGLFVLTTPNTSK